MERQTHDNVLEPSKENLFTTRTGQVAKTKDKHSENGQNSFEDNKVVSVSECWSRAYHNLPTSHNNGLFHGLTASINPGRSDGEQ